MADKSPTPLFSSEGQSSDVNSKPGHSEDYFGTSRDFWWNYDFVELMAKRLNWSGRRKVLEVGCGSGHWTRTFASFLPPEAEITCIDRDPKWSVANAPWTRALSERRVALKVQQADATALPFTDSVFDFVTCQTVLIHLTDPRFALAEMLRVLQPGGLLLCIEPDNFAVAWSETSLSAAQSLDDEAAAFKFALAKHRGRTARGLGNLSLGGRLPALFAAAGVTDIQAYLSDKAIPLFPPYDSPEQAAMNGDTERWFNSATDFTQDEARANYVAGGGIDADFEGHWTSELSNRKRYLEAIRRQDFDRAGGALMYLVSGVKDHTP